MSHGSVQELNIYPVKSCQGQTLKELNITSEGPEGDRQWMLIDEQGTFITQRTLPKLATVQTHLNEQGLSLGLGKQFFVVPKNNSFKRGVRINVWDEEFDAALEPDLFSQALSQYLGVNCRLVRYAPFSQRKMPTLGQGDWQPEARFSDSRPLLLTNTKSLEDLNSKLAQPVAMDRFRANIVFAGTEAFEEDTWSRIRIGDVIFSQPKKCARCKIITIDQHTGLSEGAEPLKTLSTYRRDGNKVNFGVMWIPENSGVIRLSDKIEVL
ncbi:MOSC domain-containing protein [Bdellovibrio sp. HCB337]|uniref:MOSC domain-containing protein n=1 Tax=Bdellovibrio sp. HCB337 TaxID=3394358 RepID=UPI0039A48B1C